MRILIVTSSYHPHKGGVETVVRDLAAGLVSHRDRVIVVTNLWPARLPIFEILEGVLLVRVPMIVPGGPGGIGFFIKKYFTNSIFTLVMVLFKPSIINVQCVGPNGYWANKIADRFKIPIVVSTHGERTNDSSGFYVSKQSMESYSELISRAGAVVCVSEVSAKESLANVGLYPTNLSIIPNAIRVNKEANTLSERQIDITFVGRLVVEKGVDVLLQSLASLRHDFPSIKVRIVGDGPSREALEKLAEDLDLMTSVLFTGQLNRDAVNDVLVSSKILALPSRKESFGLVLLEAANAGCAVVATATGGIPSIIDHGLNGLLFDTDSDVQLAECLRVLLSAESRRLELVHEFSKRLPAYDVINFVDKYRAVFAEVLS